MRKTGNSAAKYIFQKAGSVVQVTKVFIQIAAGFFSKPE